MDGGGAELSGSFLFLLKTAAVLFFGQFGPFSGDAIIFFIALTRPRPFLLLLDLNVSTLPIFNLVWLFLSFFLLFLFSGSVVFESARDSRGDGEARLDFCLISPVISSEFLEVF